MPLTREEYKQKFLDFDTSGDGQLTYDEFKQHIKELLNVEVSDAAVRNVFDSVNKSQDSYITLDEWLDSLDRKSLKDVGKDDLMEVFKKVDVNKNGTISYSELVNLLKSMKCTHSEADIKNLFDQADSNDDGTIGFNEFAEEFFKSV